MAIQKVHLDNSKRGKITCPNCGQTKTVNAAPFKTNQPIKVRCQCQHEHEIQFEQRVHNRKTVRIKGKLKKNAAHPHIATNITINNISIGGLQFSVDDSTRLAARDRVELVFVLDNFSQSQLSVTGVIRYVNNNRVGLEFENLDMHTLALLRQYTPDSAQSKSALEPILTQKLRLQDETLCIIAVQRELRRFFSSVRRACAINFEGNTWDDALKKFRLNLERYQICNRCRHIIHAKVAETSQYRCKSCNEGHYTTNPKELWDIILSNGPSREKYFSLHEAISATQMTSRQFTKTYEYGFLVPIRKQLYDNTLIGTLRSALDQSRSLGICLSLENIDIRPTRNKIRIIRKRNYDNDQKDITIGRSETNDIVFYGDRISNVHAYLYVEYETKSCRVADAGSANGTFLNRSRLLPTQIYEIKDNDVIVLGGEVTLVYLSSAGFHRWINTLAHSHDVWGQTGG